MRGAEPVIAALDVGTTGVKAALVTRDGRVVASATAGYPTHSRAGGVMEQSPEDWWEAACQAMQACEPGRHAVAALGLSGQMQALIALGLHGPLRPAILYSDTRAAAELSAVERLWGKDRWWAQTGNVQDATSLPPKLLWLQRHEPETYRSVRWILLGAHDYVTWRACGEVVTDLTTAATTGLLDLAGGRWALEMLEALGLRTNVLPPLTSGWEVTGRLMPEAAAALHLPPGIPVIHGAGDAATTTLGAGAGDPGRGYLYLGTSGWLAQTLPGSQPQPETGLFTLRHPQPSWQLIIGPLLTAAGNLEWIRQQLGGPSYEALEAWARQAPPGAGGVLYLPYLAGERSPFRNPNARASFMGIGPSAGRPELVRSVLEGVAFALRSVHEAMAPMLGAEAGATGPLGATGGGCRSDLWCEIIAAVLGRPLRRLADPSNVGVRGAVLLAGRALGWYDTWEPSPGFFPVERNFEPEPALVQLYEVAYGEWVRCNPYLMPEARQRG